MQLLIVDDEMQIRTGLEQGIDWKNIGIDQVYTAQNGVEAIEICHKYQPEIILTDIRMPGIDGLELSRQVIKLYEPVKIIILSGYSDFDYAREAIKIGVIDYLLKPIKIYELINKVEVARDAIQNHIHDDQSMKDYERLSRIKIINGFILGKQSIIKDAVYAMREYTSLKLQDMVLYGVCTIDDIEKSNLEQAIIYINTYLNKHFFDLNGFVVYTNNVSVGFVMDVLSAKSSHQTISDVKEVTTEMNVLLKNQFGVTVSTAISLLDLVQQIPILHRQCEEALSHRLYIGKSSFILYSDIISIKSNSYIKIDEKLIKEAIKIYDYDRVISYISREFDKLKKLKITSSDSVKSVSIDFKNILIRTVMENGVDIEYILESNKRLLRDIPQYSTIDDYYGWVESLYYLLLKGITHLGGFRHSKAILDVIHFVSQNYKDNITIEMVSQYVSKSKNYFSYLFKKEMNMSFVEYLNKVRIEKAKELLNKNTYMKYEISEMVGYSDYKYFSSVFKKIEGCSPTQYKNKVK